MPGPTQSLWLAFVAKFVKNTVVLTAHFCPESHLFRYDRLSQMINCYQLQTLVSFNFLNFSVPFRIRIMNILWHFNYRWIVIPSTGLKSSQPATASPGQKRTVIFPEIYASGPQGPPATLEQWAASLGAKSIIFGKNYSLQTVIFDPASQQQAVMIFKPVDGVWFQR